MNKAGIIKHKDIFEAWLDGSTIEYYDSTSNDWFVIEEPNWGINIEYRVKTEYKYIKYRRYLYKSYSDTVMVGVYSEVSNLTLSEFEAIPNFIKWIDHDWLTPEEI